MDVFFLRHGLAGDRDTWQGPDAERPLTDEGRTEMESVATYLAGHLPRLDAVVSSPLVRAYQTAEILVAHTGGTVDVADLLAPGFDVKKLWHLMRFYPGARRLLLVGHEPDFSQTIEALTGGGRVAMKKGGLARVRLSSEGAAKGTLLWLVPPAFILPSEE
jgi:phosphohistidine phosphatase